MRSRRLLDSLSGSQLIFAGPYTFAAEKPAPPQRETVAKPLTDKERKRARRQAAQRAGNSLQEVAERGRGLHHHRRRTPGLEAARHRRGARAVHRAVLAAPRPHARHRRERIQGRALPPHRLRQRALTPRASPAGRPTAAASTSPSGRRTRIESHPSGGSYERPAEEGGGTTSTYPVRAVALSLDRGHRHRHHHRVRRSHHDGRVPHDHGPVREGRPAHGSRTPVLP